LNHLFNVDTLIVLIYLTVIISVGLYGARSISDSSRKYFFANHNLSWFIISLSLFATNITGNQVLGIIGVSSMDNLIPGQFGAIAALSILVLGWVFAPDFIKGKIRTAPEYLEKKYNKSSRILFAIFSVIFYFFIRLTITLLAAGFVLSKLFNIDAFTVSQIIVILTGIYVIIGGFPSVVYTQAIQSFFILLTVFFLAILGIFKVGDLGLIWNELTVSSNAIIKPLFSSGEMKILSFIGGLIIGIWFWCTDQFIVQRFISAKNNYHARQATVFSGFLHILVLIFILIITISAGILYSDRVLYLAFSKIILEMTMQIGLKGIILTGILAILMASLASLFNSIATVIAYDFAHINIQAISEHKLVLKGRLITLAVVIFSIIWIPVIRIAPMELFSFLVILQIFCAPTIAATFLYARIHNNSGFNGANTVILIGTIIGILYTSIIYFRDLSFFDFQIISSIINVSYMYFIIILFGSSYLVLSVLNRKKSHSLIKKLKHKFSFDQLKYIFLPGQSHSSEITMNATLSVILAIIVISMWWVFKI
jgi:SSS family solute:Na+ symporter